MGTPETKQDVLDDIARLIGGTRAEVSIGSTEPKAALVAVVEALGIDVDSREPKPRLAAAIVRSEGLVWDSSCDSTSTPSGGGSTVTMEGLRRVRSAVEAHVFGHHLRHEDR